MNNTKRFVAAFVALIFIMIVGFSSLGIAHYGALKNNETLEIELNDSKTALESVKNELASVQESLQIEIEKSASLNNEIETANSIIAALKSEEYIVGATVTKAEIDMIAKTVWGEARGLNEFEQSMVVWCILNRVDDKQCSIAEIVTAPNQFHGYNKNHPVTDEIRTLVEDVIVRWKMEKVCNWNVGRTLPKEYLWFHGDGKHNYFRNAYSGNYNTWNCECWNPYN
jgi:hypothetical protein